MDSIQIHGCVPGEGPKPGSDAALRVKDPMTIVIFGASGDLSKRKLVPALYHLHDNGFLPDRYAVIGMSRSPMTDEAFREANLEFIEHKEPEQVQGPGDMVVAATEEDPLKHPLISSLYYHAGNNDDLESFRALKAKIEKVEKEKNLPGNRLFYLSVAPDFFGTILENLNAVGLITKHDAPQWTRAIIEKPFGRDLKSAQKLNTDISKVLHESQIYRIDHYLGKETVQNILSFRFGNSIFEPLFNNHYIDNVQITVSEALGMEGRRGAYYDTAGALRDMVTNHILQLLCLTAMEAPSSLDAKAIRDEKVKVLSTLPPLKIDEVAAQTVRGQYSAGTGVKGYMQEEGVKPDSVTESYVAVKVLIDNWRWAGVPFLIRTGKRMHKRVSEIAIQFKRPPTHLFRTAHATDFCMIGERPTANKLILQIQPREGMLMSLACKTPGMQMNLAEVNMDFNYQEAFKQRSPEAYERLLLDALRGDASLFTRADEVEHAWAFTTSILEGWAALPKPKYPNYAPFSDGPDEANRLCEGPLGKWRSIKTM